MCLPPPHLRLYNCNPSLLSSRGWFEDEEDFQARCAYEAAKAKTKFEGASKKKAGSSGAGGKGGSGVGGSAGWATVASVGGGSNKRGGGGSSGAKKSANGFASLSLDD